jgi:hypothetical protein
MDSGRVVHVLFSIEATDLLLVAALVLAIIGLIADIQYRRKGGKKSTKRDFIMFGIAALVVIVFVFVAISIGADEGFGPSIMGHTVIPIVSVLFATWELGRWRVRRKNPLSPQANEGETK